MPRSPASSPDSISQAMAAILAAFQRPPPNLRPPNARGPNLREPDVREPNVRELNVRGPSVWPASVRAPSPRPSDQRPPDVPRPDVLHPRDVDCQDLDALTARAHDAALDLLRRYPTIMPHFVLFGDNGLRYPFFPETVLPDAGALEAEAEASKAVLIEQLAATLRQASVTGYFCIVEMALALHDPMLRDPMLRWRSTGWARPGLMQTGDLMPPRGRQAVFIRVANASASRCLMFDRVYGADDAVLDLRLFARMDDAEMECHEPLLANLYQGNRPAQFADLPPGATCH